MNLLDFKTKFDWEGYIARYPDLKKGNSLEKAWGHANNFGWKENRVIFTEDVLQKEFLSMKNRDNIDSKN